MPKRVNETKAGVSIAAWVILDKKGNLAAKVHAHFADSGVVTVDVYNLDGTPLQQGRASGWGYDKLTAALSGVTIAGVKIYDHCGGFADEEIALKARMVKAYAKNPDAAEKRAAKLGMRFANGGDSCFFISGLDRLLAFGFTVIQAI